MSINFNDIAFTEPELLSKWNPPNRAGLYAIMIPNQSSKPKPFEVVYFGESGNMSERGYSSHHKRDCWLRQASNNENNLFISTYYLPSSTDEQRRAIEAKLVAHYKPHCND
ncbi:MAG: hypothetical protein ABSA44_10620 [Bacteroidota bacterium]|jgi:hypothetical protein